MVLILNKKGYIIAFNSERQKESVNPDKNEVWYDGEFSFDMSEDIKGKGKLYKYVNDKIEIIYYDILTPSEPQPTQLDLIQQAVEKSNEELRQEAAEAVTLELIERGIL